MLYSSCVNTRSSALALSYHVHSSGCPHHDAPSSVEHHRHPHDGRVGERIADADARADIARSVFAGRKSVSLPVSTSAAHTPDKVEEMLKKFHVVFADARLVAKSAGRGGARPLSWWRRGIGHDVRYRGHIRVGGMGISGNFAWLLSTRCGDCPGFRRGAETRGGFDPDGA